MFSLKELLQYRLNYGRISHSHYRTACSMDENWSTCKWTALGFIFFFLSIAAACFVARDCFPQFFTFTILAIGASVFYIISNRKANQNKLIIMGYDKAEEIDKMQKMCE